MWHASPELVWVYRWQRRRHITGRGDWNFLLSSSRGGEMGLFGYLPLGEGRWDFLAIFLSGRGDGTFRLSSSLPLFPHQILIASMHTLNEYNFRFDNTRQLLKACNRRINRVFDSFICSPITSEIFNAENTFQAFLLVIVLLPHPRMKNIKYL